LKTLLTSACERNCYYCPFRAGRDFPRATFTPDELARTYATLYQAGVVEGIFLSSGIAGGGVRIQDRLIDTAEILRYRLGFRGYIHLKIMPGAERQQVERSMQLADRISINLESPNAKRLYSLAPHKEFFNELLQPLRWANEIRKSAPPNQAWKGHWPSSTTQFVVGAVGETDLELLSTTEFLYREVRLKRAYYSPFRPAPDTPLENEPAESPLREQRLYQSSFLLRDYHFALEDLSFDSAGNLPLHKDPKLAWAERNLAERPIEINQATLEELLRIPGIGPIMSREILNTRRTYPIRDISDLRKLGINPSRAVPFILINGKRPLFQLSLW
jgi:predicted DNA-binding helix-hairpin-helix protein